MKRSGQRVTIGFAGIADFRSIIGQEYIAGVTKAASDYGVNLINFAGAIKYSLSDDIDFFPHYVKKYRYMRPNVIDGLVTWASSLGVFIGTEAIQALHEKLKPLPMVDLGVPLLAEVPGVTVDPGEGIRLLMDHLGDHGYSRIGFVGCSAGSQYRDRLEAWRGELVRHGWWEDPDKVGILESLEAKAIHRWVDALCRRFDLFERRQIDALVTVSDVSASILVDEFHQRGIRVPYDVAVTGFNNQIQSTSSVCPLTTVDLGYFKRGYAAVELLLDRIEHPGRTFETVIMASTLVVRQSCGCFEAEVTAARSEPPGAWNQLNTALPGLSAAQQASLRDALETDLAGAGTQGFLTWLQGALAVEHTLAPHRLSHYQDVVSVVRKAVLSLSLDTARLKEMEDLFHQARVIIALSAVYYERSHRTDTYRFNHLARIAISFASARTVDEVLDAVRFHLGELEMPGLLLVLQEDSAPDLGSGSLELALPSVASHDASLPLRIHETAFVPRSFFPRDRSWVMMFQVLSVAGSYLGYALIEAGPTNVALYDAVRTLLSHALYAVYPRAGRHSRLKEPLGGPSIPAKGTRGGLDSHTVVGYLMDRLGEMTDLETMSGDLSISKGYLIRRTKALTGHTVQALHEKLKIERACALLETQTLKVAEIAGQLGYQTQSYFSAVFKKSTGVSPKEWVRRRN